MSDFAPCKRIAGATFGDRTMYMRVLLETSPKSMKNTYKPGRERFGFVELKEHTKDNTTNGRKETVQ